jgi:hypothetical protein
MQYLIFTLLVGQEETPPSSTGLLTTPTSYSFSGLPNMDPIDKINFKMFWVNFRSNIEDGGGPKSVSGEFMKFKKIIRRNVSSSSSICLNIFLKNKNR